MTHALTYLAGILTGYLGTFAFARWMVRRMKRFDICEICGAPGEITTARLSSEGLSGRIRLCNACWIDDVNAEVSQ